MVKIDFSRRGFGDRKVRRWVSLGSAAESISRTMFFCRPTLHLEMLGSYCRSVGLRLVIDGDGMKVVWKGNLDFPSHDVITS